MKNDLISRQDAIDAIRKGYPDVINSDYKDGLRIGTDRAIYHVEQLPSAQQEIIRCKDCNHGVDYYHEGNCYCSNPKWGLQYFGGSWEFYCADAERRNNG